MATLKAFKLTGDGDLDVSNGRVNMAEDSEAIKATMYLRLDSRQDTYFLNLDFGLDNSAILGKPNIDSEMNAEFKQGILETPGVLELTEYNLNLGTDRVLTLNATVKTIFTEPVSIQL
jgi:hypothetical protein